MTTQTVRWLPIGEPIPEGWRKAGDAPAHHSRYSVLIEEVPAVPSPTFPPLIYARASAVSEMAELRVVEYEGDNKIEREWRLPPDKAVSLGLELAALGWRLKLTGTP